MDHPEHPGSWQRWFREHGPRLLLCARQWTRSLADAEDVVQDAFVRYWRRQRSLGGDPTGLLLTSIRRAATDRARQSLRRDLREQRASAGEEAETSWFEPGAEGDERTAVLEAALRRLPEAQRQVIVLKIWGGRTFEEIGAELGIPVNTAASRYRYALEALRKTLSPATCHE